MIDTSRLRQEIYYLDQERKELQDFLLRPQEMVYGSFYEFYRRCGNPTCRCSRGKKHLSECLSTNEGGKTKLIYVRKRDVFWVRKQAENYRRYQKGMARVRKINTEIFEALKKIRDSKLKRYR